MVAKSQLVTAEELLDMPDDGYRYELVRGELRKMAPASYEHGRLAGNGFRLAAHSRQNQWPGYSHNRRDRLSVGNKP